MRNAIRSTACLVLTGLLVAVAGVTRAAAQTGREVALEMSVGSVSFIEASERFVGGAARFYLSPRFAVGPDVVRIRSHGHTHTVVTADATIDFPQPKDSVEVPYVVFGLGMVGTSYRSGTAIGQTIFVGGGIRCVVKRFTIGADLRVGTPLQLRVSLLAGIRLGN